MFGIGSTVGAGIFSLTGVAAKYAGPSLFMSFIISGSITLMSAMMVSELSSRIPMSGAAFSYAYVTIGELPGWIVGWSMMARFLFSAAALARSMASYYNGLF